MKIILLFYYKRSFIFQFILSFYLKVELRKLLSTQSKKQKKTKKTYNFCIVN